MASDSELLRAFVRQSDEGSFVELVRRRIDFVYGAALRQVSGDAHRARDITQEVFVKLARHAATLSRHPTLLGWLCTTTRFAAIDALRSEQRRKAREKEAAAMQSHDDAPIDWHRLQPVLDEALTTLTGNERELVLARYFDRQPFAQIARELGITENAAQRRAERALERLRAVLVRRRITSTSAALGAVLAHHVGVGAPAGLAVAITESALVATAAGATTTGLGIFAFMSTTKITLGIVGALATLGLGTAYLGARAARDAEATLTTARQRDAALVGRVRELESRLQQEAQRSETADQETGRLLAEAQTPASPAATIEPITAEMVSRRFRLAQGLVESGDPAAALRELIWCYDIGMPHVGQIGAVRSTSLLLFGALAERHPPAATWLRERRDAAKQRALADALDREAVSEYARMNRALKDYTESVATMDSLPPDDRRRRELARSAYDYLVEQRRYQDALTGTPYASMSLVFESRVLRGNLTKGAVIWAAQAVETLAGAGDVAHARELAERLFRVDGSAPTRALIQSHAERAGQPALLAPQTPAP